jgi:hypothetical protein
VEVVDWTMMKLSSALGTELVPREHYQNAATWRSSAFHLSMVAGPALGGLLYGFGSAGLAYGTSGAGHKVVDPEKEFAKAHYEQHMKVHGTIEVDGEVMQIEGLGLRDHSWGPRYWQAIHSYRWLTINFGPDFGMMVSTVWRDPEHRTQAGVVYRGDKMDQIVGVDIDTKFEDNGLFHKSLVAHLKLDTGEQLDVTGKVMGVTSSGTAPLVGAQVAVVSMMSMFTGYPTAVTGEENPWLRERPRTCRRRATKSTCGTTGRSSGRHAGRWRPSSLSSWSSSERGRF